MCHIITFWINKDLETATISFIHANLNFLGIQLPANTAYSPPLTCPLPGRCLSVTEQNRGPTAAGSTRFRPSAVATFSPADLPSEREGGA